MTVTVGSLSSGYGGVELALSLGGMSVETRWFAEIDADASRVLKTHWPEVPNLGDFTIDGFWESAERCDLHVGGIPCQPFSAAGRQRGAADARHLWPFWRRGIELQRPAAVLFENVANLTRGKMRPIFDGICADLVALGYDVRWCLLGACAVGAAHHRHRAFLLARRSTGTPGVMQVEVKACGQSVSAYLRSPNARDGDGKRGQGSVEHMRRRLESGHMINLGDQVRIAAEDGWDKYAEAIARHEAVLGRPAPEPTEIGPKGGRRLAAAFSEWLMMLPAGHLTDVLDRNPALARAGNGVVPLQAMTAWALLTDSLTYSMHRVD